MVDKTLSTPLYRQVYNALARDIENGVYPLATPLPPERELSTMFGVDRITIRRALDILSTAGMVVRKPGSGTYVQSTCVKADEPQPVPDTGGIWALSCRQTKALACASTTRSTRRF